MTTRADETIVAAARLYRPAGRFARSYVASKLRRDPVAGALLALGRQAHFGDVADLGCGRGQFAAALLQADLARSVIGIDCQAAHLKQASMAMAGLPFQARLQDFGSDQAVPPADTVLLIDVLYQLQTPAQHTLLSNAARAARRLLIIRTADPSRGLRSVVTHLLESGFRAIWPHAGTHVNAQPPAAMAAEIQRLGFTCSMSPCWRGTPFSNMLLVGRREIA